MYIIGIFKPQILVTLQEHIPFKFLFHPFVCQSGFFSVNVEPCELGSLFNKVLVEN